MDKKIYGLSSKHNFGKWDHVVYVFDTQQEAEEWLETEESDFRERELVSKSKAVRLAGKKKVAEAEENMYAEQFYRNGGHF